MAFEGLSEKLSAAFKKLRSKGKLSESDLKDAMREVRLALLEADVNYKVAKDFTNSVIEKSIGANVLESLTPAQMVIKIVRDELTELMGGSDERLNTTSKQTDTGVLSALKICLDLPSSSQRFSKAPKTPYILTYASAFCSVITNTPYIGLKTKSPRNHAGRTKTGAA